MKPTWRKVYGPPFTNHGEKLEVIQPLPPNPHLASIIGDLEKLYHRWPLDQKYYHRFEPKVLGAGSIPTDKLDSLLSLPKNSVFTK